MDYDQTIKSVPKEMATWIEKITKGVDFKRWEADGKWDGSIGKMLVVKVDLTDVNAMSKKTGIPKKTVSSHKVVDVNLKTFLESHKLRKEFKKLGKVYSVRFRETSKKKGSKSPDATSTRKQELASAAVFKVALAKKSKWATVAAFKNDKDIRKAIIGADRPNNGGYAEAYDDPDNDWISVFWKQHKTIIDKLVDSRISEFNREGKDGVMDVVTEAAKGLGVTKKDNWNPADIWGTRGSDAAVIKKIKDAVEGSDGTKFGTQTIQQLNSLLRGMYKSKELIGISLKKTSGAEALWEEYNIEQLTLNEVNDYRYNEIGIILNFKPTDKVTKTGALDTAVQLRQSGGGAEYNFQITSNDTAKPNQNLKFESKPVGGAKARGGKAEIKQVEKIVEELVKQKDGGTFKNKHQNYPKNLDEFLNKNIAGKDLKTYKKYFTDIQNHVTTDCKNVDEFVEVISDIFNADERKGGRPWVAQSKLMQLTFIWHDLKIKQKSEKIYSEFWTDMLFLSIKKGDRFGPFAKLY